MGLACCKGSRVWRAQKVESLSLGVQELFVRRVKFEVIHNPVARPVKNKLTTSLHIPGSCQKSAVEDEGAVRHEGVVKSSCALGPREREDLGFQICRRAFRGGALDERTHEEHGSGEESGEKCFHETDEVVVQ